MIQIINQDILEVKSGVMCHQVNCRGKMGAGLALEIRQKYPEVYDWYMYAFNNNKWNLGEVQIVDITENLKVANCAGQYNYGRNKQYTDYDALKECFKKVNVYAKDKHFKIYLPYKMGCNLGGGKWSYVLEIIANEFDECYICRKEDI